MAETLISPGVLSRENDISFIQPAPIEAGAAFIGPAVKGPVEEPTLVTSYGEYQRVFGTTFESGSAKQEYLTSLAVKNYFAQGGNSALITRTVSGTFSAASSSTIFCSVKESGAIAIGATLTVDTNTADGTDGTHTGVALTGGSGNGAQATVEVSDNAVTSVTVTAAGAGYEIGDILTIGTGTALGGTTEVILDPLSAGGIVNASPFSLETLGKGVVLNSAGGEYADGSLASGTADNLRFEISNVNTADGTFVIMIRRGDDSHKNKAILETFKVSLDPNSDNYIEKIIGNQVKTKVTQDGETFLKTSGEYVNRSKYVRVSAVNLPTLNYLAQDGLTVNSDSDGDSFSDSLPAAGSGSFSGAQGSLINGGNTYFENISTTTQGLVAGDYTDAIAILENQDEYQFNIISAPGLIYANSAHRTPLDAIVSLAETRGDCIAVVDFANYGSSVADAKSEAAGINSSYAATYWPWLQVASAAGGNVWVPAGVVIPGVYAFTDGASAPWFAPAGLVRGGIPTVIQTERKLTRTQRDDLYSSNINPIATFPGQGIAVFGQKTLQKKSSALDRVNVRRLLIELKKFIGDQSKNLVFEQNTVATRNKFLAAVNPYLESVVQRQGLYAYRVVMDDSNNTPDVIDRNQLIGQIFIQPAKTVEFIVLDFTIEPTGATFNV